MRDVGLPESYPLISKALTSTEEVRRIHEEHYAAAVLSFMGLFLLDRGYRIRKKRDAEMTRKASGGGRNGAES